jgi:hypothetical protein
LVEESLDVSGALSEGGEAAEEVAISDLSLIDVIGRNLPEDRAVRHDIGCAGPGEALP